MSSKILDCYTPKPMFLKCKPPSDLEGEERLPRESDKKPGPERQLGVSWEGRTACTDHSWFRKMEIVQTSWSLG